MLNLKNKLKDSLNPQIYNTLWICSDFAREFGVKLYLVGGVVRDLLLDKEIFDIDITVEGDAVAFANFLTSKIGASVMQVQLDLKTAKVVFENNIEIDFASTRTECYPQKGHLPVAQSFGTTIDIDAKRRDFTVNALALSLNPEDFGRVFDFFGGILDLNNKQLRVLHDSSFIDDPSRIIRGLKFSVRFGFNLEKNTLFLQEQYLSGAPNPDISFSRLKSELLQAFSLNNTDVLDKFICQKIYKLLIPDFNFEINPRTLKSLVDKYLPQNIWAVYLGCFLVHSELPFGFTKSEKKIFSDVRKLLRLPAPFDNFSVYKFFENVQTESVLIYYLLTKNLSALHFLDDLRFVKLSVTGDDIIALGVKPSSNFQILFDSLLEEKLSGSLHSRLDELNFLKFKIKQLKK